MRAVAEIRVAPRTAQVYEHGWQSWSPAGLYPAASTSPRPARPVWQTMAFRPELPAPPTGFQGEGLLVVDPGDGEGVHVLSAPDPARAVASIRARLEGDRLLVEADGEVREDRAPDVDAGLRAWAEALGASMGAPEPVALGPGWCSWYCYWREVTARDVLDNLAALDELDLEAAVVQVDDGWQAGIGDWLTDSPRFGDLADVVARIRATGRRAGIWLAPFLVAARSELAAAHPDWLVRDAEAGFNWDQPLRILDPTHPEAAEHLQAVVRRLAAMGIDYFKIDFLYAGAQVGGRHADADPIDAYRHGLRLVRDAAGPGSTILGCGAPLLPSVGLVDAMRVSPDIDPAFAPPDGDVSQPSGQGALLAGRARAFQHARLWVNDPDCLLARPEVEHREQWADHVARSGGLVVSSDPLRELDDWGLQTTRRLLAPSSPEPVTAGPEDPIPVPDPI